MPQKTAAFFILEILVLVIFGVGLIGNVAFWLSGTTKVGRQASLGDKLRFILANALRVLRERSLGGILLDWLFQRRILSVSKLRWAMHLCFFWGTVILYFVGSLGLAAAERGLLPIKKDDPWFAFVNDFAGAMVIFAVGVAMYRRFVLKERQLRTGPSDVVVMALLSVIVLSGFGLEAARLIAQNVPGETAWFAFIGYPLSLALQPLNLHWSVAEVAIWWVHVVSGMSFVAYLPYSKLFHLVASPLVIAANVTRPAPRPEYRAEM